MAAKTIEARLVISGEDKGASASIASVVKSVRQLEEVSKVSTGWAVRLGLYAAAGLLALLGLVLVGVSLLVWAGTAGPNSPLSAPTSGHEHAKSY